MDRIINKLRTEPVRVRLYGVAVLVLGYLKARGVIADVDAEFFGSLAVIVLAVETTRAKVMPMAYEPKHKH